MKSRLEIFGHRLDKYDKEAVGMVEITWGESAVWEKDMVQEHADR